MNCETARRLMHLNGEGERTREEERALLRHLEDCASCAEEYAVIPSADAELQSLIGTRPVLRDPESLTADILRQVRQMERERRADILPRFFLRAPVRFAMAAALVLLLGGFILQMYQLQEGIRRFESSLASRSPSTPPLQVVYGLRADDVRAMAGEAPSDLVSSGILAPGLAGGTDDGLAFSRAELRQAVGRLMRTSARSRRTDGVPAIAAAEIPSLLADLLPRTFLTMRSAFRGGES